MKLSQPQFKLLLTLRHTPQYVADYYPPLKSLIKKGLIKARTTTRGSVSYEVTEDGKKVIDHAQS